MLLSKLNEFASRRSELNDIPQQYSTNQLENNELVCPKETSRYYSSSFHNDQPQIQENKRNSSVHQTPLQSKLKVKYLAGQGFHPSPLTSIQHNSPFKILRSQNYITNTNQNEDKEKTEVRKTESEQKMIQDITFLLLYIEELHKDFSGRSKPQLIQQLIDENEQLRREMRSSLSNDTYFNEIKQLAEINTEFRQQQSLQEKENYKDQIDKLRTQISRLSEQVKQSAIVEKTLYKQKLELESDKQNLIQNMKELNHHHEVLKLRSSEILVQNQALQEVVSNLQQSHNIDIETLQKEYRNNIKPPIPQQATMKELQELRFHYSRLTEQQTLMKQQIQSRFSDYVSHIISTHKIEQLYQKLQQSKGETQCLVEKLQRYTQYNQQLTENQIKLEKIIESIKENNNKYPTQLTLSKPEQEYSESFKLTDDEKDDLICRINRLEKQNQELSLLTKQHQPDNQLLEEENLALLNRNSFQQQRIEDYQSLNMSMENEITNLKAKIHQYKQILQKLQKYNQSQPIRENKNVPLQKENQQKQM